MKHGDPSTSAANSPLFSSSPLSSDSQRLLKSPRKPQRKVPKNPYKVSVGFFDLGRLFSFVRLNWLFVGA